MGSSPAARKSGPTQTDWSDALAHVLAEPELVRPVFQPIVDLERGVACGYEMLARFVSPIRAAPPTWLAEAARRGLESRLEAMLVEVGLDAMSWVPDNCFLTINVSPRALASEEVADVLASRTSLEGVVIEVTEQAEVEDYGQFEYVLSSLRAAGAAIAVDDAGAGYASLQHIVALRPQFVKLDRSLVADLDRDEAKLAVIESLGTFSSRIDAWMVAEGIERAEEIAALQRLRVPLAQGYWLGMPAPGMEPVAHEQRDLIRHGRPPSPAKAGVAALVERLPAASLSGSGEAIAQVFASNPGLEYVTVLDASKRPVAIVPRQGFFGGGARDRAPMKVELGESIAGVSRRAMTRPFDERFDPVVCCDPRGRYVGVVKVERLVDGLAGLLEVETEIREKSR
jgi:EAL domain-containing protein (putative c-di-GMP-specific phosphodiesterase class I)